MKRSEFVNIVNEVMEEERENAEKRLEQLHESSQDVQDFLAKVIGESYIQSAETAATVAGKIIERVGLIHFD